MSKLNDRDATITEINSALFILEELKAILKMRDEDAFYKMCSEIDRILNSAKTTLSK